MRISTKLYLFAGGVLVALLAQTGALVRAFDNQTAGYNAVLDHAVKQADMARVVQVDFKKQVQEWKDILLRGHNPEDLAKYTKQFQAKEAAVLAAAQNLQGEVTIPEVRSLLGEFATAHQALSANYAGALDVYVKNNFDFKAADKMVRGKDRPPTDIFDKVVASLDANVTASEAAQRAAAASARQSAMVAAGLILLAFGAGGIALARNITTRIARLRAVSDRLANADIEGLSVNIPGNDELGELGESMKGVVAAFHELYDTAAQAQVNKAS